MALITRQSKGDRLSITELDGNFTYLESLVSEGGTGPQGQVGPQGPGGTGGGGPVVPSTAKLFLPDVGTVISALLDIVNNYGLTGSATYSDDILWSTFTASNVTNITGFVDVTDFYIGGFYNEVEFENGGDDVLNTAYTGNFDFNVLNGGPNPEYRGGSIYFAANIDTNTYEVSNNVNVSFTGDVGLNYSWEDDGGLYIVAGIFSGIGGPTILTFDMEIDVTNDTVIWDIDILGGSMAP